MRSFRRYQYRCVLTEDGLAADGDYIFEDIVYRFKDGYLSDSMDEDGNLLPAVETKDRTHIEHWKNGVLHCVKEAALKDAEDNYEEWYLEGKVVMPGGNNGRIQKLRRI